MSKCVKNKYELPSGTFPYKISKRLVVLSVPRPIFVETEEGMPQVSPVSGVRKSALRGMISDRVHDSAYPYIRRLLLTRRMYKKTFSQERMEYLDRLIEAVNAICYTKLANATIDLKKFSTGAADVKDPKRKKGWNESEWKKHMDYINQIAAPRPEFEPPPISRGNSVPLSALLPHLKELAQLPDDKLYRRPSQEPWYRDPLKVSEAALKYVISDRVKKLATPRALPGGGD